jgi:hypothetical protein
MPCSRRGKPRHISINARRFQGEWEALWTQALRHNNREVAHSAKELDGKPPAPASFARSLDLQNIARARTPCQRQTLLLPLPTLTTSCKESRAHPPRQGPHHTPGISYLASEGRHRRVVGGRRRAGVHPPELQYQAHCQVLPHTLPCQHCGH